MNNKIKEIARISIIASLYVLLTIFNPFSYDSVQFRISEIFRDLQANGILMKYVIYRAYYSIMSIRWCGMPCFSSAVTFADPMSSPL